MTLPAAVLKGIAEFNRGEFFEAHETLEGVWAEESGRDRLFYQGLIQVAVGCCHLQRGNAVGAGHLLALGLQKLEAFPSPYLGLDVASVRGAASRCAAEVGRLGEAGLGAFDTALFPKLREA